MLKTFYCIVNELSTTDQGKQYQEIHRGGREGFKTLVDSESLSLPCTLGTVTLTYNPTLPYALPLPLDCMAGLQASLVEQNTTIRTLR